MERATIDFGIDLGTTNSSIAVLDGIKPEIFKNNDGQEITPSAVWIDGKGRLDVGHRAKQQLGRDKQNAYAEFKLLIGTQHSYTFAGCGRQMTPVELSAEVLKSLRGDVQQRLGEEIITAAIGVPAAFELPECEATKKAAQLAGLLYSPLIQEPIAAAIAYEFQSESDRVFWLVYDFGGGTFDAAIISARDEQIKLVNHGGDLQLGGKLIDWEIVEQLLAPAVAREYNLSDFSRGNKKWGAVFAQLKMVAEDAKICLSRVATYSINTDLYFPEKHGGSVRFEFELNKSDIEPLIEPYIERSVNICKKVLKEERLSPGDIEKIILVGGPTLTPIVREMLHKSLEIPLEFHIDALTAVTRGAAIWAGSQRLPEAIRGGRKVAEGQFAVELDYLPISSEAEPQIGGTVVVSEGESTAGFTIEFVESKNQWRSGRIDIGDDGTFITIVAAEKGRTNEFLIELRDGNGNLRQTVPDRFKYTIGSSISGQTLIKSVGVALANNQMDVFLTKGTPLPARHRAIHYTTVALKQGKSESRLKIPVVEGENAKRADRNPQIGYIVLSGDMIHRDLPLRSDIEIIIEIDESRQSKVKAYIPFLDEEIKGMMQLDKPLADPQQLADDFEREKARLGELRDKIQKTEAPQAEDPLQRIQNEQTVHQVETSLAASLVDPDAAAKCASRILDLKIALDEAEDVLKLPVLISESEEQIQSTRDIVDKHGDERDKQDFRSLEQDLRKAISAHDEDLTRQKLAQLQRLEGKLLQQLPEFWVGYLSYLEEDMMSRMTDQASAKQLIIRGRRAIDANNLDELKLVVRELICLLPVVEQQVAKGYGGTTMRL